MGTLHRFKRIRPLIYMIVLLGMSTALAACGIKPGGVNPPEGADKSAYPRTYPDLKHDPVPPARGF